MAPISPGIVTFTDPLGGGGRRHPFWGQYPAKGVMTYYSSSPSGSCLETCTLPEVEHALCASALITFIAWYGKD